MTADTYVSGCTLTALIRRREMITFGVYDSLCEDAARIRTEVFVREQGFVNEFDGTDDISLHIVAYDDGVPVATCRLIPGEDGVFTIGRVAVSGDHRGRSLGSMVMAEAERQARARGAERVELASQVRAKGFYESCGYTEYGEVFPDEGCPHIMMSKVL